MTARLSGIPSERKKRNGDGVYYIQNYYDADGKRRQGTGPTPRAATADAKRKMLGSAKPSVKSPDTTTFEKFSEKFIEDSKTGRSGSMPLDYHTIRIYESYLNTWIIPRLGSMRIASLTRSDVSTFRDELVAETNARSTAVKAMTITKSILSYAVECGIITSSPAQGVSVSTDWSEEEDRKEDRIPSIADMRKIEETAKSCYESEDPVVARAYRRYYPFFLVLRTLGLRASEAIGLQWGDFSDDMSRVNIRRKVGPPRRGMPQENRVQRTKSKNGRRTIPVPVEIVPVLRQWKKECPATEEGWVFPTRSGNPVTYDNMKSKFWDPLIRRAELSGRGFGMHSMRHYFASTLIRKGRAKEAQTYLGHHSAAFTMDQYGHLFPDDKTTMDEVRSTVMDGMAI